MDLTRLLEIDTELLRAAHDEAMGIALGVWMEDGCPETTPELIATLEKVLRRCHRSGVESSRPCTLPTELPGSSVGVVMGVIPGSIGSVPFSPRLVPSGMSDA